MTVPVVVAYGPGGVKAAWTGSLTAGWRAAPVNVATSKAADSAADNVAATRGRIATMMIPLFRSPVQRAPPSA